MPLMQRVRASLSPLLLALAASHAGNAQEAARVSELFRDFEQLLDRHVIEKPLENGGLISAFDYRAALQQKATATLLERQQHRLAEFDTDKLDGRQATIAFWLNTYNFFMVAHILENRPEDTLVDSVWDYGGRYNPFQANIFERKLFEVGDRRYSLDQIEKGTLFGDDFRNRDWADPRVHFAVNCASVGCPPLRDRLYTAGNLDALLRENTRLALSTPYQLRVTGETLYLSRIFDWYEDDFVEAAGSVRAFIHRYADGELIRRLESTTRIDYIDYDWRLNRPANFPRIEQDAHS